MLVVINPRIDPEATLEGWLRFNARLIAGVSVWAVVLLGIAALAHPDHIAGDARYGAASADGLPLAPPHEGEAACVTILPLDAASCLPGQALD